jgi:hypothetical protein
VIVLSTPPVLLNAAGAAAACGTLPITISNFKGVLDNNRQAVLSWQVEAALNFQKFEIELSTDGINYVTTGSIVYNTQAAAYSFSQRIHSGITYYFRIKLVDQDGTFKYSSIVTLKAPETEIESGIFVLTNPTASSSLLKVKANVNQTSVLKIYDETGRLIRNKPVSLKAGTQVIEVPETTGLVPGTYILQLIVDQAALSAKLVKI